MDRLKILKYIFPLFTFIFLASCTEDEVVTENGELYLEHEVPNVPVSADYQVGAFYLKINVLRRNNDPSIQPTIGVYNLNRVVDQQTIYAEHLEQARTAGIDYFIYDFRTAALNGGAAQNSDIRFMDNILLTPGAGDIKMAFAYNFGAMGLNNNNTIESKGHVETFINDFKAMMPFFEHDNYMKVEGKNVVYLTNGQNLFSQDNVTLYKQLRDELSALGHELFIVGSQPQWTPPLRFDYRFVDCVDALTHLSYIRVNRNTYERYLYFHTITDLALQYHKERLSDFDIEYIPSISPSIDLKFNNNPNDDDNLYIINKEIAFFKNTCNVARNAAGKNRLVILDSFNNWNINTQIESDNTNGDTFLKLLKQEFKVE